MAHSEYKIYKSLSDDDIPNFLRELADWLESGCEGEQPTCDIDVDASDFHKLKLGFKRKQGQIELKLKVRTPHPEADQPTAPSPAPDTAPAQAPQRAEQPQQKSRRSRAQAKTKAAAKQAAPKAKKGAKAKRKPPYKNLKKRMKATFKELIIAAKGQTLPTQEVISSFIADSRLMTQYRGKGEPHYATYEQAVLELEEAFAAKDARAYAAAVERLNDLKTACHAEFK